MRKSLEEPTVVCDARRDDDLGAVRGILVGSLCGGVAWGLLALSFWSKVFQASWPD